MHQGPGKSEMVCHKCAYGQRVVTSFINKLVRVKAEGNLAFPRLDFVPPRLLCAAEKRRKEEELVQEAALYDV